MLLAVMRLQRDPSRFSHDYLCLSKCEQVHHAENGKRSCCGHGANGCCAYLSGVEPERFVVELSPWLWSVFFPFCFRILLDGGTNVLCSFFEAINLLLSNRIECSFY
jgi:hypothetical protein